MNMRSQRRTGCAVLAVFILACWYLGSTHLSALDSARNAYLARGQNSTDTAPKVFAGPPTHLEWFQTFLVAERERVWKEAEVLPWREKRKSVKVYFSEATTISRQMTTTSVGSEAVEATVKPTPTPTMVKAVLGPFGNATNSTVETTRTLDVAPRASVNVSAELNTTMYALPSH